MGTEGDAKWGENRGKRIKEGKLGEASSGTKLRRGWESLLRKRVAYFKKSKGTGEARGTLNREGNVQLVDLS